MRYLFPAVITALVALTAAVSHAKAPSGPVKKAKAITLADPCEQDFEIKVVVTPAESADAWPIGFTLAFKAKTKRGIASRIQTQQESAFDGPACERWQKRNWGLLDRILYENKRVERAKVVCHNVAAISYRLGSKSENTSVCLGLIKEDSVAYAFKSFLESGDGMVE